MIHEERRSDREERVAPFQPGEPAEENRPPPNNTERILMARRPFNPDLMAATLDKRAATLALYLGVTKQEALKLIADRLIQKRGRHEAHQPGFILTEADA